MIFSVHNNPEKAVVYFDYKPSRNAWNDDAQKGSADIIK